MKIKSLKTFSDFTSANSPNVDANTYQPISWNSSKSVILLLIQIVWVEKHINIRTWVHFLMNFIGFYYWLKVMSWKFCNVVFIWGCTDFKMPCISIEDSRVGVKIKDFSWFFVFFCCRNARQVLLVFWIRRSSIFKSLFYFLRYEKCFSTGLETSNLYHPSSDRSSWRGSYSTAKLSPWPHTRS